jgi:hypothetical protein
MQIIYGGIQIANEPPAGTDGVLGFELPKAEQNTGWMEGLRAKDAVPRSYGNRKRTLTGNIYPAPLATPAAAKKAREQFYEVLPLQGPLITVQDTEQTIYAVAVLRGIDVIEAATEGVGYGLKFTFLVSAPQFSGNPTLLVTSTGKAIVTSTGEVIRTGL